LSLPVDLAEQRPVDVPSTGPLASLQHLVDRINSVLIALSAVAAGTAGCVLTWEVAGRYFFKIPSYWQDELSVFLLVGATFGAASWIQTRRGHIGISALEHILSPGAERVRRVFADFVTFAFCLFFCCPPRSSRRTTPHGSITAAPPIPPNTPRSPRSIART